ncbi:unnamed protein product [Meloidogyne enterolobii]|uniref:Uncharacterized protein n=1 Tax=Meloidogyne enterolobii TaxID=390850 RepID=A0ACB0YI66_MELEN
MFKTANAPFCFNPRLQAGVVVTNSWTVKSGWDVDHIYGNPFRVGEPFILEFRFGQYLQRDSISIYVNNKFLATYSYFGLKGYHDLKNVTHLYISGFRLDTLILCPNDYLSTTTQEPTYAIEE